ncbi:attP region and P4int integrase [Salmonella enterica subsp. enterica serovar Newport]|nr:attP region and P4int integrase [Salmonella enterica subsp. enterica serovar Newport]
MTKVKSRLFTIHQPFTTYRHDIKEKNSKVNSVNSVNSLYGKKEFY